MNLATFFYERNKGNKEPNLVMEDILYDPNESLGAIHIHDRRIVNLTWSDVLYSDHIDRAIHFDWWVEQKPEPAEPVQQTIQY